MFLGLDFGTSGARAMVIGADATPLFSHEVSFRSPVGSPVGSPDLTQVGWAQQWRSALHTLLEGLPVAVAQGLAAIAINGTSATVLLCNDQGQPVTEPLLYSDDRGQTMAATLAAIAPPGHRVHSSTSSLAKLLWWQAQPQWQDWRQRGSLHLLHQADWLGFLLHGQLGFTDYHNALKLGYDVETLAYPPWLLAQAALAPCLPQVVTPGQTLGVIQASVADRYHINPQTRICAGTTDSIAAFLASGARKPGQGVTSLGSTLVIKLLSRVPLEDNHWGIYSHRLGDRWLVGGASNTGGAVLQQFFGREDLTRLSAAIDPRQPSPLDYYPLLRSGERFPINDPHLPPRLSPRPGDPVAFLHGLLESMARIESQGYALLGERGADTLTQVYTAGGGAQNSTWTAIRQRLLGVPVARSPHTDAAYGTACLARSGLGSYMSACE